MGGQWAMNIDRSRGRPLHVNNPFYNRKFFAPVLVTKENIISGRTIFFQAFFFAENVINSTKL